LRLVGGSTAIGNTADSDGEGKIVGKPRRLGKGDG